MSDDKRRRETLRREALAIRVKAHDLRERTPILTGSEHYAIQKMFRAAEALEDAAEDLERHEGAA